MFFKPLNSWQFITATTDKEHTHLCCLEADAHRLSCVSVSWPWWCCSPSPVQSHKQQSCFLARAPAGWLGQLCDLGPAACIQLGVASDRKFCSGQLCMSLIFWDQPALGMCFSGRGRIGTGTDRRTLRSVCGLQVLWCWSPEKDRHILLGPGLLCPSSHTLQ